MNDLVMYFEKEKFLRQTLEGIFKTKGAKIHTEDGIEDRFYLIDDLKPNTIIIDLSTVTGENLERLLAFNDIKFIATKSAEYSNPISPKFSKVMTKPLTISGLFEKIKEVNQA